MTVKILPGKSARAVLQLPRVFARVEAGPDVNAQVELADAVVVGRAEDCGLVVTDSSVSLHHARIERRSHDLVIEDLGSTNGTFINRVRADRGLASIGDRVRLGGTTLILEDATEPFLVLPEQTDRLGPLVGASEIMRLLYGIVLKIAPTEFSVLIEGETGTGKELLAQAIHQLSTRSKGPFVVVNGPALVGSLAVSELFGHERGAYTGADALRQGAFERACGGTLFLDEVGDLSAEVQAQLLRVLESRSFSRVGGDKSLSTDVRVIAATNRDLPALIHGGTFRSDLFFRLSEIRLSSPPLRERLEDIPLLVVQLVRLAMTRLGRTVAEPSFSKEALDRLASHGWSGNVRELRNYVARAVAVATNSRIEAGDLPPFDESWAATVAPGHSQITPVASPASDGSPTSGDLQRIREMEVDVLRQTLARCGGNKARAARELGLAVTTLKDRIKKHGL